MSDSGLKPNSPYVRRQLLRHIGYVIVLVVFAALGVLYIPLQVKNYLELRKDLAKISSDVSQYRARLAAIQEYPSEDLEELVRSINTLYPSEEDRFSIFGALDNLQVVTGIDVISYSSPFSGKSFQDVSINVKANASLPTYRKFLKDHVYKSGRFMTIARVEYSVETGDLTFTANFYSKHIDINTSKPVEIQPHLLQQAAQIKKEVEAAGLIRLQEPVQEVTEPTDYSTKDNPFQ